MGRMVYTRSDLMESVREGFPIEVLESVIRLTDMTREEVATVISLPARTLTRRKQAKHLQPVESDRLFRVARVAAHGGRSGVENRPDVLLFTTEEKGHVELYAWAPFGDAKARRISDGLHVESLALMPGGERVLALHE